VIRDFHIVSNPMGGEYAQGLATHCRRNAVQAMLEKGKPQYFYQNDLKNTALARLLIAHLHVGSFALPTMQNANRVVL
jgi:hypothetical protein